MNMSDLTKNIDKKKLNSMLDALSGSLSGEDMAAVKKALDSPDLGRHLNGVSRSEVNKAVNGNAELKKALGSNPELMKNLSAFLNKK